MSTVNKVSEARKRKEEPNNHSYPFNLASIPYASFMRIYKYSYDEGMKNVGANTNQIEEFINNLNYELNITDYIDKSNIPMFAKNFMNFTFKTIQSEKDHIIAAVFTFGREDLIPDMFIEIVKNISSNEEVDLKDLIYYLERHIEVDAEDHGPMALKMIKHLCGNDQIKWKEALDYSKTALNQRIKLWNAIEKTLN